MILTKNNLKKIKKTFVLQLDSGDCGVVSLLSIIKYHGGNAELENLRITSGTDSTGTSLLGLYQCSLSYGFDTKGYTGDFKDLLNSEVPVILHVILENKYEHYIVFYGKIKNNKNKESFIIGDPAIGILEVDETELLLIWKSKHYLDLKPNSNFLLDEQINKSKLNWIFNLLKQESDLLAITISLGIFSTIISLSIAVFTQKLIDKIIPSGDKKLLLMSIIILFLILGIATILNYIKSEFLLKQSKNINSTILNYFFDKLLYLPKTFFDFRKIGDLITRKRDVSNIQSNITYITSSILIDLILIISISFLLFNYSKLVSIIIVALLPFTYLITRFFLKPIKNQQIKLLQSSSINESYYIDHLNGIGVIKSNGKESQFSELNLAINESFLTEGVKLGKISNNFSLAMESFGLILSITLISISSYLVITGSLMIGEMMAIITLSNKLVPAFIRLTQINVKFQDAKITFDRMFEFTSIKPELDDKYSNETLNINQITIENLKFRFPGRTAILDDISILIKRNYITVLLGENGSGKSTLIQILQKFYSFETGKIKIDNQLLQEINTQYWRKIISVVPQEIKIFNGSIIYNICLDNDIDKVSEVIKLSNDILGDFLFFDHFPQKYNTIIGEEGINISGGQKQIIGLLRALVNKPQLLLLDEVTSALDRNTELFILNLLQRLKENMCILLITHKIQTAKIGDLVYIISNGVIQDKGHPNKLIKRKNLYSDMFNDFIS
jgi:ATP-binding cassette subfamily B protein